MVCCPSIEWILYSPVPGTTCKNITGAFKYKSLCAFMTCADLMDHGDKWYCGKQSCNFLGCNCGSCIQLDQWGKKQVSLLEKNTTVHIRDLFLIKYRDLIKYIEVEDLDSENLQKLSSTVPIGFEIN